MIRKSLRVVVGLTLVGLMMNGFLALPTEASTPAAVRAAAQGVTKNSIEIVLLVPDVDALKARGIQVANLSNADFVKRFSGYVDAFGPINGRKIVVTPVGWDPLDNTSFDKACTAATQDNKPFVVVNGSGYQASSIACITVDNKTPLMIGDMAYGALQKASGKNLVTLGLPSEVEARAAAELVAKTKTIPKTAKIGILSNNTPGVKAAGDTLQSELEKRGYHVVSKVEVNGLAGDNGVLGRESQAAVGTFQAKGVDTVFIPQVFLGGWTDELQRSGAKFKVYSIDGQANVCTPYSVSRGSVANAGATCITAWGSKAVPTKDKIKPDTAFEAKCRKEFDASTGKKSLPGGGSGALTVNDVTYQGDIPPNECMIANLLLPAIKKAGNNPTWDKVYANLMATKKAPAAYLSEGEGGFGKNKPYFANPVLHFETFAANTGDTPKDANGLYNGCAIPAPCWVPQLVNGQEWFPVKG